VDAKRVAVRSKAWLGATCENIRKLTDTSLAFDETVGFEQPIVPLSADSEDALRIGALASMSPVLPANLRLLCRAGLQ